jgi:hypothetical protein
MCKVLLITSFGSIGAELGNAGRTIEEREGLDEMVMLLQALTSISVKYTAHPSFRIFELNVFEITTHMS